MPRALLLLISLSLISLSAAANNNIEFLDKKIIRSLSSSVLEVVVPKIESDKIQYIQPLPFDQQSFSERKEKFHSIGTAFFINEKELMTAAHVFGLEQFSLLTDFHVRDTNGNTFKVSRIKKYSTIRDMAVIELESYPQNVLPLKLSDSVEIGDTVFSVGNAQGEGISFRAGQIASFTDEPEFGLWKNIRFTSPASPGNSGGPLINLEGDVLGVIIRKNESENFNVSVPIAEAQNIGDEAVFHLNDISIHLNDEQNSVVDDWNASFKLPSDILSLANAAQNSLDAFYASISSRLTEKFESTYFPRGERFRSYLREQIYVKRFGVLRSDADFTRWTIHNYSSREVPISEHQKIEVSSSDLSTMHVVVEKPETMSLAEFCGSPRIVMDNMLKAIPLSREMAGARFRITSLGEPEASRTWEDKLGRRWVSSLWYLSHIDSFGYSHCLPYPGGAICNVDFKENSGLKMGYMGDIEANMNEVTVGYEGDVGDWTEYFSLDKKILPGIFQSARLSVDAGAFHLNTDNFEINFNLDTIDSDSSLHFHLGYSNTNLLAEDLLLFELFPRKGDNAHYRVQQMFSPNSFSSDKYKSIWEDIVAQAGKYSGKVIDRSGQKQVFRILADTRTSFNYMNTDEIESVIIAGCFFDASEEKAGNKCDGFVRSLQFPAHAESHI